MRDKPSVPDEGKFPYYALRETVWPLEERRRILWVSIAWGVPAAILGVYATLASNQPAENLILAPFVAAVFGISAFIVRVFSGIILDRAIEHSDESKRAAACLKVIEDRYAEPETRVALRASAEGGTGAAGTRSLLPIALLTIIATISAAGIFSLVSWVVLSIGLIVLLNFALAVEYANADIIILRALDEYTRRHPSTPPQGSTPDQVLVALGALIAERLIGDQGVNSVPPTLVVPTVEPANDKTTADTEIMPAVQRHNGTRQTSPPLQDNARG